MDSDYKIIIVNGITAQNMKQNTDIMNTVE